jgi:hypothetical protein
MTCVGGSKGNSSGALSIIEFCALIILRRNRC